MDLLAGATRAQAQGIKRPTKQKYACNWARWRVFALRLGLKDKGLQAFKEEHKVRLLQAFMEAVRRGDFARGNPTG
eukprot:3532812-Ditylum_brightwellii.AAC.1